MRLLTALIDDGSGEPCCMWLGNGFGEPQHLYMLMQDHTEARCAGDAQAFQSVPGDGTGASIASFFRTTGSLCVV